VKPQLKTRLAEAARFARGLRGKILVVSHLDSDGICAAAVCRKALERMGLLCELLVVPQLDGHVISLAKKNKVKNIIMADLGSSYLDEVSDELSKKNVLILDHHRVKGTAKGILQVNPEECGYDGGSDVSGAGVAYLFAAELDEANNDMAYMAVIGAIGDNQEKGGLGSLNSEILKTAQSAGQIEIRCEYRLHGSSKQMLYKSLAHNHNPLIPGVSGNARACIRFLEPLGLHQKKLGELTSEDKDGLAKAVIARRSGQKDPEDVYGNSYTLCNKKIYRDAREFSTMLNACGRLGQPDAGIKALLGSGEDESAAGELLDRYRREIAMSLNWIRNNSSQLMSNGAYIIIDGTDKIRSSIVGTIASMYARSGALKPGSLVVALADQDDGMTKVSVRASGRTVPPSVDAAKLLAKAVGKTGGEFGGHRTAAGAIIDSNRKKEFIEEIADILK